MAWQFTEDLEAFLTAAGGFLRAPPRREHGPAHNPTSNTLHQRLGYRPVSDWTVLRFDGAPEAGVSARP